MAKLDCSSSISFLIPRQADIFTTAYFIRAMPGLLRFLMIWEAAREDARYGAAWDNSI